MQSCRNRLKLYASDWADETIEALLATKEEAELFNVRRRSSLPCARRWIIQAFTESRPGRTVGSGVDGCAVGLIPRESLTSD